MGQFLIKECDITGLQDMVKREMRQLIFNISNCRALVNYYIQNKDFTGQGADAIKSYLQEVHLFEMDCIEDIAYMFCENIDKYKQNYVNIDTATNFVLDENLMNHFKTVLAGNNGYMTWSLLSACHDRVETELSNISDIVAIECPTITPITDEITNTCKMVSDCIDKTRGYEKQSAADQRGLEDYINYFKNSIGTIGASVGGNISSYCEGDFYKDKDTQQFLMQYNKRRVEKIAEQIEKETIKKSDLKNLPPGVIPEVVTEYIGNIPKASYKTRIEKNIPPNMKVYYETTTETDGTIGPETEADLDRGKVQMKEIDMSIFSSENIDVSSSVDGNGMMDVTVSNKHNFAIKVGKKSDLKYSLDDGTVIAISTYYQEGNTFIEESIYTPVEQGELKTTYGIMIKNKNNLNDQLSLADREGEGLSTRDIETVILNESVPQYATFYNGINRVFDYLGLGAGAEYGFIGGWTAPFLAF